MNKKGLAIAIGLSVGVVTFVHNNNTVYAKEVNKSVTVGTVQNNTQKGWVKENGYWYYYDQNGVLKTGIFNDGKSYYLSDSEGKLVTEKGWQTLQIKEKNTVTVYVNEDSSLKTGWFKDNGYSYYLGTNGERQTYKIRTVENVYAADSNGRLVTKKGWHKIEGSERYVYIKENNACETGFLDLDGNKYYFDESGELKTGTFRAYDGKQYTADKDGKITNKNGWIQTHDARGYKEWIYKDENGKQVTGFLKLGDNTYYLGKNTGLCTGIFYIDETKKYYYSDKDGKLVTKEGWLKIKEHNEAGEDTERLIYITKDGSLKTGFLKEGNDLYYFNESAELVKGSFTYNGKQYISNDNYKVVTTKGWNKYNLQYNMNEWIYVKDDNSLVTGLFKDNGKEYYFDEKGLLKTGVFDVNGQPYVTDDNGAFIKKFNWVKGDDGSWYYINQDGKYKTGWLNENGKWYYLNKNGQMERRILIDGNNGYIFNENDGSWIDKQGWYSKYVPRNRYDIYYVKNDGSLYKGWIKINNNWYYFDYNLATGVFKDNKGTYYVADKDGRLIETKGFVKVEKSNSSEIGYIKNDGTAKVGWLNLNGDRYYLYNGILQIGVFNCDGINYTTDKNGKVNNKRGWVLDANNKWYYVDSYGLKLVDLQNIDGKSYIFDEEGMLKTGIVNYWEKKYYTDENGALLDKAGWVKLDDYGDYIYVDADKKLKTGWYKENGSLYYFSKDGFLRYGVFEVDGKTYVADQYGKVTSNKGWINVSSDSKYPYWVYVNQDGSVKKGWFKENGNTYYLDSYDGRMVTGAFNDGSKRYVFDENGRLALKEGWVKVSNNEWSYLNANGSLNEGLVKIGGAWYFFNDNGCIETSVFYKDGVRYEPNKDGKIEI